MKKTFFFLVFLMITGLIIDVASFSPFFSNKTTAYLERFGTSLLFISVGLLAAGIFFSEIAMKANDVKEGGLISLFLILAAFMIGIVFTINYYNAPTNWASRINYNTYQCIIERMIWMSATGVAGVMIFIRFILKRAGLLLKI